MQAPRSISHGMDVSISLFLSQHCTQTFETGVCLEYELFTTTKPRIHQHRGGNQGFFQSVECNLAFLWPHKLSILLQQAVQWPRDCSKPRHKSPVIGRETEKLKYSADICRNRELTYLLSLIWIWRHAIPGDDVTKVFHKSLRKETFLWLQCKACLAKALEHFL